VASYDASDASVAGYVMMLNTYGIKIQHKGDPYIKRAEEAFHSLAIGSVPGNFLVVRFSFRTRAVHVQSLKKLCRIHSPSSSMFLIGSPGLISSARPSDGTG
jgi:hypothetical protein